MAITQLQKFTNNATTTVPGSITNSATSITVTTGTGALFPILGGSEYFIATLVNTIVSDPGYGQLEIVKVTARSGDVMTIARAQESTAAKSFPAGCLFELRPTGGAFDTLYTNLLQVQTDKADLASPVFTGNPTAPTPSPGDNDTSIATSAFVTSAITAATGRLINVQKFSASGTYTPTPGTLSIIIAACGGGGGGGGCAITNASQVAVGGGGSGAAYGIARITSPTSQTVTIGGAGSAGTSGGGSGGNGGQTSVGTYLVCDGGQGGVGGTAQAFSSATIVGASGGQGLNPTSTGTLLFGSPGQIAPYGQWAYNGSAFFTSSGGNSPFGSGGWPGNTNNVAGANGLGFGSGGSGALSGTNQGAGRAGGAGQSGLVLIYEYA